MSSATTLGNRQRVSTAPLFVRQLETWLVGLNADFLRPDLTPIRREGGSFLTVLDALLGQLSDSFIFEPFE